MGTETNTPKQAFVTITPEQGKVKVTWGITTYRKRELEGGKISCYIPAFDIFFSAVDEEARIKKSRVLSRMLIDHIVLHGKEKKDGIKALALYLRKIGFKAAEGDFALKEILNNRITTTKFRSGSKTPPKDFEMAGAELVEADMEVAA